jgi:hypothetical protein
MSKVSCVVCGHTEHGDSSYCMNPSCGELLPVAERAAPQRASQPAESLSDQPAASEVAPTQQQPLSTGPRALAVNDPPTALDPTPAGRGGAAASVSQARRWLLGSAVVVVLFGLGVAFSRGTAPSSEKPPTPAELPSASLVAASAPKVTAVQDDRVAVTLVFADQSGGKAAFYVVGGPVGLQPTTLAEAAQGSTSVRINAVNPEVDYCFVVVAVLSVVEVAASVQVCTSRFGTPKS